jgi:hypothetical protein
LYSQLALAAAAVLAVAGSRISTLNGATILIATIAGPLLLAWLGGKFDQELQIPQDSPQHESPGWPWFGPVLFVLALVKFTTIGFNSSGFTPTLHDEWSYLFGAETFAHGHLSNPTPQCPEFFDAFHILTTPRWVTRYPPGHPAALAIGTVVGWPPAIVIAQVALTVWFIYLIARELAGETAARLAGTLAFMAPGLDYLAGSYLSQSTFLCSMTGCYAATLFGVRRQSCVLLALAGLAGGWAILTRPYSAMALGVPLAGWFIFASASAKTSTRLALAVAGSVPIVVALGLFALYNRTVTGSPLRTAWGEYNRQFEPDNTLGFSNGAGQPIPSGISERKAERARGIAAEKTQFTSRVALRRVLTNSQRVSDMILSALGFYGLAAFIPFGLDTSETTRTHAKSYRWLLGFIPLAHYVAYSLFYSTWGAYSLETIPWIVLAVAVGLGTFWKRASASDRPGIALTVPLCLAIALLVDVREIGRLIEMRRLDTSYHRDFAQKLDKLAEPAIVFVRFDKSRRHVFDLINNSPDLSSGVVVVLDLGDRNSELIRLFPDRALYIYDETTGQLTSYPDQVAPQTRLPGRQTQLNPTSAGMLQTVQYAE